MTERKFRHLSRLALIDIIYELQRSNQSLQAQLSMAQTQLEEKYIALTEAGTLAEAVVKVHKLMEAAQETADDYLFQVRHMGEEELRRRYDALEERQEESLELAGAKGETQ